MHELAKLLLLEVQIRKRIVYVYNACAMYDIRINVCARPMDTYVHIGRLERVDCTYSLK